MTVMGLSRITKRVRFLPVVAASLQIACTKDTGSTGARVLMKRTKRSLSA